MADGDVWLADGNGEENTALVTSFHRPFLPSVGRWRWWRQHRVHHAVIFALFFCRSICWQMAMMKIHETRPAGGICGKQSPDVVTCRTDGEKAFAEFQAAMVGGRFCLFVCVCVCVFVCVFCRLPISFSCRI